MQLWAMAFKKEPTYRVVVDTYNILRMEGHPFPEMQEQSDAMFVAERPPEWKEGRACFACRTPFSLTVRRHHCRNCGQIFCQQCSSKECAIPKFGIEKMVRVCDQCYDIVQRGGGGGGGGGGANDASRSTENEDTRNMSDLELMQRLAMQVCCQGLAMNIQEWFLGQPLCLGANVQCSNVLWSSSHSQNSSLSPEEEVARALAAGKIDAEPPKANRPSAEEEARRKVGSDQMV